MQQTLDAAVLCARLSTSPNHNSTISKRRISHTYNIQMYQIVTKNIIIQEQRNLQNLLIEVKIEIGDYEKTQSNSRKQ
jgi:hypothetical protein